MQPVTAAGGVVVSLSPTGENRRVLLIYRRGVWDLPKGKQEQGEAIEACAVREVAEEIGLSRLPEIVRPLIKTYHEYEQDQVLMGKTTHWYLMKLEDEEIGFTPQTKEGIEEVAWHSLQEAKEKVGYDNLRKVLNAVAVEGN